MFCHQSKHRAS